MKKQKFNQQKQLIKEVFYYSKNKKSHMHEYNPNTKEMIKFIQYYPNGRINYIAEWNESGNELIKETYYNSNDSSLWKEDYLINDKNK